MRSRYQEPFGPGFEKKRKALYTNADVEDAGDQLKRLRVSDTGNVNQQPQEEERQPEGEHQQGDNGMNVSNILHDP